MSGVAAGRCGAALVGALCDDEPRGLDYDQPRNARTDRSAGGCADNAGRAEFPAGAQTRKARRPQCISCSQIWQTRRPNNSRLSAADRIRHQAIRHHRIPPTSDRRRNPPRPKPKEHPHLAKGTFAMQEEHAIVTVKNARRFRTNEAFRLYFENKRL